MIDQSLKLSSLKTFFEIGLVESAIWILAVSQVIKDIDDPVLIAAYAFGFANNNRNSN